VNLLSIPSLPFSFAALLADLANLVSYSIIHGAVRLFLLAARGEIHLRCGRSLFPKNLWGSTEPLCPTLSPPLLRTGRRHRTHGTPSFNASSRCGSRCARHPRCRCVSPVFLGLFCCMALDMLHNFSIVWDLKSHTSIRDLQFCCSGLWFCI